MGCDFILFGAVVWCKCGVWCKCKLGVSDLLEL